MIYYQTKEEMKLDRVGDIRSVLDVCLDVKMTVDGRYYRSVDDQEKDVKILTCFKQFWTWTDPINKFDLLVHEMITHTLVHYWQSLHYSFGKSKTVQ